MSNNSSGVIIVGAGPVGLAVGHTLGRAEVYPRGRLRVYDFHAIVAERFQQGRVCSRKRR